MSNESVHCLNDKWVLWSHLPHDTDWSNDSYKQICTISLVEELIQLNDYLDEKLIKNCMLFFMRDNISPTWEDPNNIKGGCFSYKINNKNVKASWNLLSYAVAGETSIKTSDLNNIVNGITISPKKNFCIIKIWINTCNYQDARIITDIPNIEAFGCLFKKHIETT